LSGKPLHIVIVNWNSGNLLRECIASLAEHGSASIDQLVIVDNGSADDSAEVDGSGLPLRVIRTGANLGFAAACNLGAADASAPYILLLNPDTRLYDDAFSPAVAFMESPQAARIGVCGIQLRDEHGQVQRHSARFPTWRSFIGQSLGLSRLFPRLFPPQHLDEFDHLTSRPVDHVIGAFYLIRRHLWEQLGGLDERFFVYLEDIDLSYRAAAAGWGNYYLADVNAFHKAGGTSEQVKAHRLFYAVRSRILFAFKHFSRGKAWVTTLAALLIEPFARLARGLLRGSRDEVRATWSAYRMLYGDLGNIRRRARAFDQAEAARLP